VVSLRAGIDCPKEDRNERSAALISSGFMLDSAVTPASLLSLQPY